MHRWCPPCLQSLQLIHSPLTGSRLAVSYHSTASTATNQIVQIFAERRHLVHHENVFVSAVSSSEPVDLPHLAQYWTCVTPSAPARVCWSRMFAKRR